MKKTLIVVAHPNIEASVINKRWITELKKQPNQFSVHELYKAYPDGHIDVEREQALIEAHGALVLQFPLYWFNSPPLLKKWLDDVFTYGWAYGSKSIHLKNRKMGIAVSAGIKVDDFSKSGHCGFTLNEILRPFEMVALYTKADYQPLFAFYGANSEPDIPQQYTADDLEKNAQDYITHLKNFYLKF